MKKLSQTERKIYDQFTTYPSFEIEGTDDSVIYYLHINDDMKIKSHDDHMSSSDIIITHKFDKPDGFDDMIEAEEWENLECPEFLNMIKDLANEYESMFNNCNIRGKNV